MKHLEIPKKKLKKEKIYKSEEEEEIYFNHSTVIPAVNN